MKAITTSFAITDVLDQIRNNVQLHKPYLKLKIGIQQVEVLPNFIVDDGMLKRRGRWVVRPDVSLKQKLLSFYHDSVIWGYLGTQATFKMLNSVFYWPGMEKDIREYVRECLVC